MGFIFETTEHIVGGNKMCLWNTKALETAISWKV